MKGFILSLRSEFYKSRKTLGFWSSIILPFIIYLLVFLGFFLHADSLSKLPSQVLWLSYTQVVFAIMGILLLPMYLIIIAYSVNSIEHRADTWKSLFSLPISKWAVYSAKFFYAFLLVFMCLLLFFVFTITSANLLSVIKPELKFNEFNFESFLGQLYLKLFLASLGILSIQFLLSLIWSDFLKPMGIGFIGIIVGDIVASRGWEYAYWIPYAHPLLTLNGMFKHTKTSAPPLTTIDIFTKEIFVSLGVAAVFFIAGYFIVQRKSVK